MSDTDLRLTKSRRLHAFVDRLQRLATRAGTLVDCVHLGRVTLGPVTVRRIVRSIIHELAGAGISVELDHMTEAAAGRFVHTDLARLPRLVAAMRAHMAPAATLQLQLGTTHVGGRPALLVVLRPRGPQPDTESPPSRSLEWLIAERLVAQLGGEIEPLDVRGERLARLALPFTTD